tara:strand:- start:781 stop:1041 length:261 start_codon:yes stop_codon:yes gene_type:complete
MKKMKKIRDPTGMLDMIKLRVKDFIPLEGVADYYTRTENMSQGFIGLGLESEKKVERRKVFLAYYNLSYLVGGLYGIYKGIEALIS